MRFSIRWLFWAMVWAGLVIAFVQWQFDGYHWSSFWEGFRGAAPADPFDIPKEYLHGTRTKPIAGVFAALALIVAAIVGIMSACGIFEGENK
jgi:hypothetical protein